MSEWVFQRDAIRAFRFVRCAFEARTGVAQLAYAFDDGPELIETVAVPGAPFVLDHARAQAVERALRALHLIAGVSYYKAAVPEEIRIDAYAIDADTAALLETVYLNGLGEFAYQNKLDLRGRIRFPHAASSSGATAARMISGSIVGRSPWTLTTVSTSPFGSSFWSASKMRSEPD